MLASVYLVIERHRAEHPQAELLGFFNCGKDSGASQPHCHFQMVELVPEKSTMAVPIENLLQHIERDGKEYSTWLSDTGDVHLLPVPWQHFVVLLDPPSDETQLSTYLGHRFTQLLDCMFAAARDLGHIQGTEPRRGPPQFNILLTKRAMHLIPRRQEGFDLNTTDWAPYNNGQAPEHTGTLSVNALGMSLTDSGYAGLFLTRHKAELEAMTDPANARIAHVLAQTGVPIPIQEGTEAPVADEKKADA